MRHTFVLGIIRIYKLSIAKLIVLIFYNKKSIEQDKSDEKYNISNESSHLNNNHFENSQNGNHLNSKRDRLDVPSHSGSSFQLSMLWDIYVLQDFKISITFEQQRLVFCKPRSSFTAMQRNDEVFK